MITVPTSNWSKTAEKLYQIKNTIKRLQQLEAGLATKLKKLSFYEDASDGVFILTKSVRRGHIEYSFIPELSCVDLEQYRKAPVAVWTLTKRGE